MDAFDRIAAAAVAGMQETNGRPLPLPGQWIHGTTHGKSWAGEVMDSMPGRVAVDCGSEWIAVSPKDVS